MLLLDDDDDDPKVHETMLDVTPNFNYDTIVYLGSYPKYQYFGIFSDSSLQFAMPEGF